MAKGDPLQNPTAPKIPADSVEARFDKSMARVKDNLPKTVKKAPAGSLINEWGKGGKK